jgi:hypothetical protein
MAANMPQTSTVAEPKAALGPAGQRLGHVEKFSTEPGAHQDIAGQDEERNGGQREGVDAGEKLLADQEAERQRADTDKHGDRGCPDRRPDRHGKRHQHHEQDYRAVEIPAQFKRLGPDCCHIIARALLVEQLVAFVDGTPVTKIGEIAEEGLRQPEDDEREAKGTAKRNQTG